MNIVVLAGGISTEREVSLTSGRMIYEALKKKGHQVILLDVFLGYEKDVDGNIFTSDINWAEGIGQIKESNPDLEAVKKLRPDYEKNYFGPNVISICQMADVVFLALHGENGENGKVQAYFDLMGITYTGTDYLSSALAMDKALAKELFVMNKIRTPEGIHLKKGMEDKKCVPFPCVVKSCCGGSSVGVCIANNEEEYEKAKEEAFKYDDSVIIEQYIKGREFSVGVIDGKALPVIEIAPIQGFYDYKNKYQAGSAIETCPAEISIEKTMEMQGMAEKVFKVLRLKKYARMDFMMSEDETIYCLEANTLPGMTPTSLIPQEALAIGISFEEFCEMIIRLALGENVFDDRF